MEILEYAMQMELDGERFYRDHLPNVRGESARRIVEFLAQEEHNHYQTIKAYGESATVPAPSSFVADVKNIFQQMKADNVSFDSGDADTVAVLEKALEIEDRSVKFYGGKLEESTDDGAKKLLSLLKREEDRHYSIVSNLLDFHLKPRRGSSRRSSPIWMSSRNLSGN